MRERLRGGTDPPGGSIPACVGSSCVVTQYLCAAQITKYSETPPGCLGLNQLEIDGLLKKYACQRFNTVGNPDLMAEPKPNAPFIVDNCGTGCTCGSLSYNPTCFDAGSGHHGPATWQVKPGCFVKFEYNLDAEICTYSGTCKKIEPHGPGSHSPYYWYQGHPVYLVGIGPPGI